MATVYVATPYAAVWDPDTTNLTLVQKGSVEIELEWSYTEVSDNDHGDMPVDMISRGIKTCVIRVPVTDHDLATIRAMLPLASYFSANGTRVEPRPNIGASLLTYAKELVLKKFVLGSATTDETLWITAPKAVPTGIFKMSLGNEQSVYTVEFRCFPDTTKNNRPIYFGDEAAS